MSEDLACYMFRCFFKRNEEISKPERQQAAVTEKKPKKKGNFFWVSAL